MGSLESAAVPGVKQALRFSFLVRLFAGRGRIRKELRKGLIGTSVDSSWVTDSLVERYTAGAAGSMGAVLRALKRMDQSVERLGGSRSAGKGRLRVLSTGLPQFTVDTIPGAGLHLQEEQPDAVAAALRQEVEEAYR